MDLNDPTKMADVVVPYEVNSPLWSDSASKSRGFVVPVGKKIHVKDCAAEPAACKQGPADTGKWMFPVGTVMVKNFSFDGKLVETRLFVHFDEQTWVGYGYQWDEAQKDATIVPDQRRKITFNTGQRTVEWNYPSRLDCMKCHTPTGGSTLGPETAQMNRLIGGTNQIDALAARNLFDAPPAKPYKTALVVPYAGQAGAPGGAATLTERARSYMHANCAFCHRPDDPDYAMLDMRYDISFRGTQLCGLPPVRGDQGVANSKLIDPGNKMNSVVWLRMAALPDLGRMPQIGTYHVDADGVSLVGDWINSLGPCP